jgi:hypothetical protein
MVAMRKIFGSTKSYLAQFNTTVLISLPSVIGLGIGILYGLAIKRKFIGSFGDVCVLVIVLFFWGLSGLAQVIKREQPIFGGSIKGLQPIIIGYLTLIFWWGMAIVTILFYVIGRYN